MKKLYNIITLLLSLGALSNIASGQIVNIPDAAFKAALVGNSPINTTLTALVCFYDSIGTLDVSMLTALTYFDCSYNKLTSLNMRNGNNINLQTGFGFNAKHNPNLTCIQVDDSAYMNANWPNGKD